MKKGRSWSCKYYLVRRSFVIFLCSMPACVLVCIAFTLSFDSFSATMTFILVYCLFINPSFFHSFISGLGLVPLEGHFKSGGHCRTVLLTLAAAYPSPSISSRALDKPLLLTSSTQYEIGRSGQRHFPASCIHQAEKEIILKRPKDPCLTYMTPPSA